MKQRRWNAIVEGPDSMLTALALHFRGRTRLERGPDGWELTDERFEALASAAEVGAKARELVSQLSALGRLRLSSRHGLAYGGLVEVGPAGHRTRRISGVAHVEVDGPITSGTGTVGGPSAPPPPPESWERYLDLASDDERVHAALAFLDLPPTWHHLSAALDAVKSKQRRPAGRRRVKRTDEEELFHWTANNYAAVGTQARHGDPLRQAPDDPMTLPEARAFVRRRVMAWLDELLSPAAEGR